MHGNGISAERVNHQNIKILLFMLLQFAFQGETRVARNHIRFGRENRSEKLKYLRSLAIRMTSGLIS